MRDPVKKKSKPMMRTTHRGVGEGSGDSREVARLTKENAQLRDALEKARLRIVTEVTQREHAQQEYDKLKRKP